MASEGVAPLLSQWLYGEENGSELNADQKETISSILSLASTAVGATTGNASDAVAAGQASENAVENNFYLGSLDMNPFHSADPEIQASLQPIRDIKPEHMTSTASTAVGVAAIFNPFAKILTYVGIGADVTTTYLTKDPINMLPGFMGQGVKTALKGGKLSEAVLERTDTVTSLGTSEILSE